MKIFSVAQIKEWDSYTILNEPVKSIALMERAATAAMNWIIQHFEPGVSFKIFCGKGNNGGDGLAIARLLFSFKYRVSVYIPHSNSQGSPEFETNLNRLKQLSADIRIIEDTNSFPRISEGEVVIDAILGTGLHKRPSGLIAGLIKYINSKHAKVISIDVPSGLFIDKSSRSAVIPPEDAKYIPGDADDLIHATYTLTFQNQKLAFLMAENEDFIGKVILLDIGLSKRYEEKEESQLELVDEKMITGIYLPRKAFSNKGNYGYAALLAGSYGMMGAAVLSSRACLKSGVGKLTCVTCEAGYSVIQTAVPEAMCKISGDQYITGIRDFTDYDVVAIGPGIGKYASHQQLLKTLFENFKKPLVIDADGLNVLSEHQDLYGLIPQDSIITPHPKEFERLFGKATSDFDRVHLALLKAKELHIFIVLKGHYTFVATPWEKGYFNSTGNAGMATAGAGDVLTGIITGLLAQKYSSLNSCLLGVYLHGLSGDIAAKKLSQEAVIAGDLIWNIGNAFKEISGY